MSNDHLSLSGRLSPREVKFLRKDPSTCLSLVEDLFGETRVTFLRSVIDSSETTPSNDLEFPGQTMADRERNRAFGAEARAEARLIEMRRVRAFIEVDGLTVGSTREFITYIEATEDAAFELLRGHFAERRENSPSPFQRFSSRRAERSEKDRARDFNANTLRREASTGSISMSTSPRFEAIGELGTDPLGNELRRASSSKSVRVELIDVDSPRDATLSAPVTPRIKKSPIRLRLSQRLRRKKK